MIKIIFKYSYQYLSAHFSIFLNQFFIIQYIKINQYQEQLKSQLEKLNLSQIQIDNCYKLYNQYQRYLQEHQEIKWDDVITLKDEQLAFYKDLPEVSDPQKILSKFAVLKLNGGLGTSMKATYAKSLLQVREGKTFMDYIIQSIDQLNKKYNTKIPLILMNSFNTDDDTQKYIAEHNKTDVEVLYFNQFELPRMDSQTYLPCTQIEGKQLFYPPGHGYVYECLKGSPIFEDLIKRGIEYVFISNADNLGAILDPKIANYIIQSKAEFLSEQTPKTLNDIKGGVLINYHNEVHLLETAQVPKDHMKDFCSIDQFKYFHINNLYINLLALKNSQSLERDLIVNPKTVNGIKVIQLENAAGAAISHFKAKVLVVDRDRFKPVKKCGDLLLLQSNLYQEQNGKLVQLQKELPIVQIDSGINEFQEMFKNVPNLEQLTKLVIEDGGYVKCGKNVTIKGEIVIKKGDNVEWKDNQIVQQN